MYHCIITFVSACYLNWQDHNWWDGCRPTNVWLSCSFREKSSLEGIMTSCLELKSEVRLCGGFWSPFTSSSPSSSLSYTSHLLPSLSSSHTPHTSCSTPSGGLEALLSRPDTDNRESIDGHFLHKRNEGLRSHFGHPIVQANFHTCVPSLYSTSVM